MFKNRQDKRAFVAVVWTYTLDLVGFSIVFPVLAPLLLDQSLDYFGPTTPEGVRTTILGLLYAVYGIAQFIALPLIGTAADRLGRRNVFLITITNAVFGYLVMAFGVLYQSLWLLFIGRIWTGISTGNMSLAQSVTADLTTQKDRGKAFGYLIGIGSFGFMIGPWIGGKLANPAWIDGSGAFFFGAAITLVNLVLVWVMFKETFLPRSEKEHSFVDSYKAIGIAFTEKHIRRPVVTYFFFATGWAFYLLFVPTFWVQRFGLNSNQIGDIIGYSGLVWALAAIFLNKWLIERYKLPLIATIGCLIGGTGMIAIAAPPTLWPLWITIPYTLVGGALAWTNLNAIASNRTPIHLQGRVMGVTISLWSIAQVLAGLFAGPLSGWNIYLPLSVSAALQLIAFAFIASWGRKPVRPD